MESAVLNEFRNSLKNILKNDIAIFQIVSILAKLSTGVKLKLVSQRSAMIDYRVIVGIARRSINSHS